MGTRCSYCGRELEEKEDSKYCRCRHCNIFVPKGAQSYSGKLKNSLKGGYKMSTTKKASDCEEKDSSDGKKTITEIRAERAESIRKYALETLKIPKEELRAVLSRLYNTIARESK